MDNLIDKEILEHQHYMKKMHQENYKFLKSVSSISMFCNILMSQLLDIATEVRNNNKMKADDLRQLIELGVPCKDEFNRGEVVSGIIDYTAFVDGINDIANRLKLNYE
ncbi:hypothetical protein [Elizabethkingia anophelis]|uniref:hypothetical protein n=1 Tax=Elizabethkingia anophelis TaxID=1117645 RepID=UPI000DD560AD|nr:hypothetical protein [Elizabethkingia anophelis]MDV3555225.1 hypothetical protein [Elizabethkingia anophelis]MDV3653250.1 hypothetical protein [Elizabethkingia anophelis]RBA36142.1 hypothetical protein DSC50_02000 [Elizabethkingia anophelis]